MASSPFRLNEAQMLLLGIFQDRHMSPAELEVLRDTLVKYLTEELDQKIDQVMKDKNLTPASIAIRT